MKCLSVCPYAAQERKLLSRIRRSGGIVRPQVEPRLKNHVSRLEFNISNHYSANLYYQSITKCMRKFVPVQICTVIKPCLYDTESVDCIVRTRLCRCVSSSPPHTHQLRHTAHHSITWRLAILNMSQTRPTTQQLHTDHNHCLLIRSVIALIQACWLHLTAHRFV